MQLAYRAVRPYSCQLHFRSMVVPPASKVPRRPLPLPPGVLTAHAKFVIRVNREHQDDDLHDALCPDRYVPQHPHAYRISADGTMLFLEIPPSALVQTPIPDGRAIITLVQTGPRTITIVAMVEVRALDRIAAATQLYANAPKRAVAGRPATVDR